MTRKHFNELAEILKRNKPQLRDGMVSQNFANQILAKELDTWNQLVKDMTRFCNRQNDYFNPQRFLSACNSDLEYYKDF